MSDKAYFTVVGVVTNRIMASTKKTGAELRIT